MPPGRRFVSSTSKTATAHPSPTDSHELAEPPKSRRRNSLISSTVTALMAPVIAGSAPRPGLRGDLGLRRAALQLTERLADARGVRGGVGQHLAVRGERDGEVAVVAHHRMDEAHALHEHSD